MTRLIGGILLLFFISFDSYSNAVLGMEMGQPLDVDKLNSISALRTNDNSKGEVYMAVFRKEDSIYTWHSYGYNEKKILCNIDAMREISPHENKSAIGMSIFKALSEKYGDRHIINSSDKEVTWIVDTNPILVAYGLIGIILKEEVIGGNTRIRARYISSNIKDCINNPNTRL